MKTSYFGTSFYTLLLKEIRRYIKVWGQTFLAPIVSSLLYLIVFTFALGGSREYALFIIPGIASMSMLQNSFANSSSSMLISKMQGSIVDVLMSPLTPLEVLLAYVLGATSRGVGIAIIFYIIQGIYFDFHVEHLGYLIFFTLAGSFAMSTLGLIGAIWANKIDRLSLISNFVITPLTFLSCTFYSINKLPEKWRVLVHADPVYYAINGFRYGMIGDPEFNQIMGVIILVACNIFLFVLAYIMLKTGYKLKN